MSEEVEKLIVKSADALKAAQELMKLGFSSDAASKAYYSMFYAARALLVSEGIDVSKHSAVESAVGFHFAKSGKLESKYHRMLIDARSVREIADYDIDEEVSESDAAAKLEDGKAFPKAVKSILKSA